MMQLAARFSGDLDGIVAELQKSLIFRFGYDVYRENWTERKVHQRSNSLANRLDHCAITVRLIHDFCIKFGNFGKEESRCDVLRCGDDEERRALPRFAPTRRRRVFSGSFPFSLPLPSTASFPLAGSIPSSSSLILRIGAFLQIYVCDIYVSAIFTSLRYLRLCNICVSLRYPRLSALQTSTYLRSGFFCLLNHVI